MGTTGPTSSHAVRSCHFGLWKAQLRHQLGGKTLQGQGAISQDVACTLTNSHHMVQRSWFSKGKLPLPGNAERVPLPDSSISFHLTPLLAGLVGHGHHMFMVWGHMMEAGVERDVQDPGEPRGCLSLFPCPVVTLSDKCIHHGQRRVSDPSRKKTCVIPPPGKPEGQQRKADVELGRGR